MIELKIDGHGGTIVASRWDRTEVAERWMEALRGPLGAAYVAAVRSGNEAQTKAAWRAWTRLE